MTEHPAELQILDGSLQLGNVVAYRRKRGIVAFSARQFKQLAAVREPLAQLRQCDDNVVELLFLAPQVLRALRIVPDVRVLELARNNVEPFALHIEVKDTSEAAPCGL